MVSPSRFQQITLSIPPELWPGLRIDTVAQPAHAPPMVDGVSNATYSVPVSTLKRPVYGLVAGSGEQAAISAVTAAKLAAINNFFIALGILSGDLPHRGD